MGSVVSGVAGVLSDFVPRAPKKPKIPGAGPPAATQVNPNVIAARQRQRAGASLLGTRTTGGLGLGSEASTTKKSLLGI